MLWLAVMEAPSLIRREHLKDCIIWNEYTLRLHKRVWILLGCSNVVKLIFGGGWVS
jgi:hypothetical protein